MAAADAAKNAPKDQEKDKMPLIDFSAIKVELLAPEVQAMIKELVKQITSAGKPAGTIAYDLDTLNRRKEEGFTFISAGVNSLLVKASREYLTVARGEQVHIR